MALRTALAAFPSTGTSPGLRAREARSLHATLTNVGDGTQMEGRGARRLPCGSPLRNRVLESALLSSPRNGEVRAAAPPPTRTTTITPATPMARRMRY